MKKVYTIIYVIAFLVGSIFLRNVFSQDSYYEIDAKSRNIDFAVDGANLYFFDADSKMLYIYTTRGEFRKAYEITKLGARLEQLSSAQMRELIENRQ